MIAQDHPVEAPAIPAGTEPWLQIILRSALKQPLGPAIATLTDADATYMTSFIGGMAGPLDTLLEAWHLPPIVEPFWQGKVLPLLRRRLNPPARIWSNGRDVFAEAKSNTDISEFAGHFTELTASRTRYNCSKYAL